MTSEKLMEALRGDINRELKIFFEEKLRSMKKIGRPEEILDMVGLLGDFVLGSGKRIRPILFCYGYFAFDGADRESIIKASISMELMHTYLLIHDDIIDRDEFRHGRPSIHSKYREKCANLSEKDEAYHFGVSMAIITGDLASSFGHKVLADSQFESSVKLKAIYEMNKIISNTIIGEAMDVVLSAKQKYTAKNVIDMQTYKTAKYTIDGPLRLGAILAGAADMEVKSISEYAIPLGIAYQIEDDIIGVFGDEKKIGKPVGSDLKEGKKTLLILKALENCSEKDAKTLNSMVGKKEINSDEIEKAREIITKTGSLDFSIEEIKRLKNSALDNLKKIKMSEEYKTHLRELADFLVKREC